jgi:hypothetical protein
MAIVLRNSSHHAHGALIFLQSIMCFVTSRACPMLPLASQAVDMRGIRQRAGQRGRLTADVDVGHLIVGSVP